MTLTVHQVEAVTVTEACHTGALRACFGMCAGRPPQRSRPHFLRDGREYWTAQVFDSVRHSPIRPPRPPNGVRCVCACLRMWARVQAQGRARARMTHKHGRSGRFKEKRMNTTTYDVHHAGHQAEKLDGMKSVDGMGINWRAVNGAN